MRAWCSIAMAGGLFHTRRTRLALICLIASLGCVILLSSHASKEIAEWSVRRLSPRRASSLLEIQTSPCGSGTLLISGCDGSILGDSASLSEISKLEDEVLKG